MFKHMWSNWVTSVRPTLRLQGESTFHMNEARTPWVAVIESSATRGLSFPADVFRVERRLLFFSDNRDDQLPRACVSAFLSCLDPTNPQHQRLMEELVLSLLKKVGK